MLRGSIGLQLTDGASITGNRVLQSIGQVTTFSTSDVNLLLLRGIHVFQRGTTQQSLSLVRHTFDEAAVNTTATSRWSFYNNATTTNTSSASIFKWATNTAIGGITEPIAQFILGPNQGDSAIIMLDVPVEFVFKTLAGDPRWLIGLQRVENDAYDYDVTWIFEQTRAL